MAGSGPGVIFERVQVGPRCTLLPSSYCTQLHAQAAFLPLLAVLHLCSQVTGKRLCVPAASVPGSVSTPHAARWPCTCRLCQMPVCSPWRTWRHVQQACLCLRICAQDVGELPTSLPYPSLHPYLYANISPDCGISLNYKQGSGLQRGLLRVFLWPMQSGPNLCCAVLQASEDRPQVTAALLWLKKLSEGRDQLSPAPRVGYARSLDVASPVTNPASTTQPSPLSSVLSSSEAAAPQPAPPGMRTPSSQVCAARRRPAAAPPLSLGPACLAGPIPQAAAGPPGLQLQQE